MPAAPDWSPGDGRLAVMDALATPSFLALARGLLVVGIVGQVGVASMEFLAPGTADGARPWDRGRRRLGIAFAVLTAVAFALSAVVQFALFRDPWAPWRDDALLLAGSPWGRVWAGAAALAVVVGLLRVLNRGHRAAAVGAVLLALYPAVSGHAASTGSLAGAAMIAQWFHITGAGSWMGALVTLVILGPINDSGGAMHSPLVAALGRFSVQARVSVATIVLTGAFATWLHLGGPGALLSAPWGRLLAAKLVLVAVVLLFGLRNWRVLSPAANDVEGVSRLLAASRVEAIFGIIVVALSAWLATTSPPG